MDVALPDKMQNYLKKLKGFADRIMSEHETNIDDAKPGFSLCHYTSGEALLGMLRREELWLTHFSFLNDPYEMIYGHKEIIAHAQKHSNKSIHDPRLQFFWSMFPDPFFEVCNEREDSVFSFSTTANDLTQWRSYASNGRGFCLEFNLNLLNAINFKDKNEDEDIFIVKMYYKDTHDIYNSAISLIEESIQNCVSLNATPSPIEALFMEEIAKEIANLALYLNVVLKHPCYESEREHRLLWKGNPISNIRFRLSAQENLISYIPVPLKIKTGPRVLERVWIGPSNATEPKVLKQFFISEGYSSEQVPEIIKSDLPYRVY